MPLPNVEFLKMPDCRDGHNGGSPYGAAPSAGGRDAALAQFAKPEHRHDSRRITRRAIEWTSANDARRRKMIFGQCRLSSDVTAAPYDIQRTGVELTDSLGNCTFPTSFNYTIRGLEIWSFRSWSRSAVSSAFAASSGRLRAAT
jgi:hypothetical protein